MFIPLATGRARQDVPRPAPCAPRRTLACHDDCAPAAADTFAVSGILAPGETPVAAAARASVLGGLRFAGGRYVKRNQANPSSSPSWCLICAQEIQVNDRIAILSVEVC